MNKLMTEEPLFYLNGSHDNSVSDFYKNYLPKGFSLFKTQKKLRKKPTPIFCFSIIFSRTQKVNLEPRSIRG